MLRRRVAPLLVAVLVAASGCVSAMTARNYVPQTTGVDAAYYECLREAQQTYAWAGGYAASAGAETNVGMLKSCMGAKGYRKRDASTAETWVGLTTAPVWLPLCLVAATSGVNCLSDQ